MTAPLKPVYFFEYTPVFINERGDERALVTVQGHPCGETHVCTSRVLQKFPDGSFETRNSIYKPAP